MKNVEPLFTLPKALELRMIALLDRTVADASGREKIEVVTPTFPSL
jgi:hypothetical protein